MRRISRQKLLMVGVPGVAKRKIKKRARREVVSKETTTMLCTITSDSLM
jgi:hypothetical protein